MEAPAHLVDGRPKIERCPCCFVVGSIAQVCAPRHEVQALTGLVDTHSHAHQRGPVKTHRPTDEFLGGLALCASLAVTEGEWVEVLDFCGHNSAPPPFSEGEPDEGAGKEEPKPAGNKLMTFPLAPTLPSPVPPSSLPTPSPSSSPPPRAEEQAFRGSRTPSCLLVPGLGVHPCNAVHVTVVSLL